MEEEDILLKTEHVKYRKSEAGRSPIGTLCLFKERVEWRDASSPEILRVPFIQIKGQRVSPPNKSKVQLQLCLQNDEQATFVFLAPGKEKDVLIRERDAVKETLQQALVAHRARVNQLAASSEKCSKSAELAEKQRLLRMSSQLEQLYKHLVSTKLISPQEFWQDYYNNASSCEDKAGISGAFLASIASSEGTNGVKLNLNTEIIQAIFNTYPVVEKKHLELVPHEMSEQEFWSKFFQSHYFHRDREVLPNPSDPFAECVREDEVEMERLGEQGVERRRFDLSHLSDHPALYMNQRPEMDKKAPKTVLVRRCNYLSERLVSVLRAQGVGGQAENGSSAANGAVPKDQRAVGYAALRKVVDEEESRLESTELADARMDGERVPVRLTVDSQREQAKYPTVEAGEYRRVLSEFLENTPDKDIVMADDDWLDDLGGEGGMDEELDGGGDKTPEWNLRGADLQEVKAVHDSATELLKHFWTCFPPTSAEMEKKIDRMDETLRKYKAEQVASAAHRYGEHYFVHVHDMLSRAAVRYQQYSARKKK